VIPDRWHVVTDIFHAALARTPAERATFVAEACRGDASLWAEVEQLLVAHDNVGSFGDAPAFAMAAKQIAPGTSLGHYRVEALIGCGGMGEVYRATDVRLDRTVALKILPSHLRSSTELQSRFQREARAISQLTHPHICTLHDVGQENGVDFLVMELLEGDLLAARLARGPIPIDQSLRIGIEIAGALDHAHRHGIVHRDLKPGNVMLTKSGTKLLDFGLAKFRMPAQAAAASSVTLRDSNTREGTLLGTLPYMAPEQLEGKEADARSDIWALGCLLYELATGRPAFDVDSQAGLIAAILERQPPPLEEAQPLAPPLLDKIVRRCVAKNPDDRWQSAADVEHALEWCTAEHATDAAGSATKHSWSVWLVAATLVVTFAAALVALFVVRTEQTEADGQVVHAMLDVAPADEMYGGPARREISMTVGGSHTALSWTPDGRALVFAGVRNGVQQLSFRRLDDGRSQPIAGTEGAYMPVVSSDGQWIAFWSAGAIKKVPLMGGAATVLVSNAPLMPMGMSWNAAGLLYSGPDGRIWYVPPGGRSFPATTLQGNERVHALPSWLPDGKAFLYTARRRAGTWGNEHTVLQTLFTGERTVLLSDAVDTRYAAGALIFMRLGTLFAVRFNPSQRHLEKEPVAIIAGVSQALTGWNTRFSTGAGQFSVSPTGNLAYVEGAVVPPAESRVVSVNLDGRVTPSQISSAAYAGYLRLSPDGHQIVAMTTGLTAAPLVVLDRFRPALTPLAGSGDGLWPVWMPDSRRLMSLQVSDETRAIVMQPADGGAPPEQIADGTFDPSSVSTDGRQILGLKNKDIWVLERSGDKSELRPVLESPGVEERYPAFSPDGHWIAYGVLESDRSRLFVQPYPGPGARVQVSTDRGSNVAWHPDGRSLFFTRIVNFSAASAGTEPMREQMMVARVENGTPIGEPRVLFEFGQAESLAFSCIPLRCYDLAPGGEGFYVVRRPTLTPTAPAKQIRVVLNWMHEVRARLQAAR
jgi:serine/threonine-protein kinase